jgi:hypothetical protein
MTETAEETLGCSRKKHPDWFIENQDTYIEANDNGQK